MNQANNLNRALAIINLINLGRSAPDACAIAQDWSDRQRLQSLRAVQALVSKTQVVAPWEVAPREGRMFASFHFSLYPLLYRALGERSGPKVVYSLIGEQEEAHRSALKQLAVQYGFQIEFIQSNVGMVKTLRRGIENKIPGILLLDIPWTRTDSQADVSYEIEGGCFLGHSSLERLLTLIDPGYEILLTTRIDQGFQIKNIGHVGFKDAFASFGRELLRDPADYERLHQFHKFFKFNKMQNCAVTFCIKDKRYVIAAKTMQAWELPGPLDSSALVAEGDSVIHDTAVVDRISKDTKHAFDYLVSI